MSGKRQNALMKSFKCPPATAADIAYLQQAVIVVSNGEQTPSFSEVIRLCVQFTRIEEVRFLVGFDAGNGVGGPKTGIPQNGTPCEAVQPGAGNLPNVPSQDSGVLGAGNGHSEAGMAQAAERQSVPGEHVAGHHDHGVNGGRRRGRPRTRGIVANGDDAAMEGEA